MLTNYYSIDENSTVGSFLRETNEKKNMQYIILETSPKSFVDVRHLCLKLHDPDEKLKQMKKNLSWVDTSDEKELLTFLMESGDRVIEHPQGYFDFLHALEHIKNNHKELLKNKLQDEVRMEVHALNQDDKISTAKKILIKNKINLLPIIEDLKIIGEFRTRDLLSNDLVQKNSNNRDFYNENHKDSVMNMEVSSLMNPKPLTIDHKATIGDALEIMLDKKIPSLIVTKDDQLYSVVSYKDIFKKIRKLSKSQNFKIELVGTADLFEDEVRLIENYAEKSMEKITKMSEYVLLKVFIKTHGNNEGTHKKKASVSLTLSKGGKVLNVEKEISAGTSDEVYNDKVKGKWNVPQLAQTTLKALEKKVIEEKRKNSSR